MHQSTSLRSLVTTGAAWLAAGALWVGCLLPGVWWLAVAAIAVAGVGVAMGRSRSSPDRDARRPDHMRLAFVALALGLLGSGLAGGRAALLDSGPLAELAARGGEASMTATVVTDARPSLEGAWSLLRIATLDGQRCARRAMIRFDDVADAPALGSSVTFTATARPPGTDGFEGYLRRLHVAAIVAPVAPVDVVRPPGALIRGTTHVRDTVRRAAGTHLPSDAAALVSGLVTGDTGGLSVEASDSMLASGLTHLVAVSGSNVALVLAGTLGLAGAAGVGVKGRRRLAVVALLWFTLLVRAEPSVLRAAAMALLVMSSQAMGRGHDARHTLAVAATLLLLVDPFLAGQLGFALSVLATAGVLVVAPLVAARVPGPRPLALLVGASVGAQLGVAPVLLVVEGGLKVGALPANLVAVPAAALASAIGIIAAIVAQVSVGVGGLIAALAGPPAAVVLWAARVFSDTVALQPRHLLSPVAAVLLAAAIARRRTPRLALASVLVVAVTAIGAPWARAPTVDSLTLTALDVGQGDALLVEVPGSPGEPPARMLVDGGPDQALAAKLLRSRGVSYLDAVVMSHPHADHTNGLPAVLSRIPTGAVFVGPRPTQELEDPAASAVAAEGVAAQRGVTVTRVGAGQLFQLGEAVVQILSPPADGSLGREPNDNSLVLRVSTDDGAILLTGDAEVAAQQRLLRRPDLLRADIIKVPHHGGATNAEGFIDAVGATTAVITVGADNDYGHPAAEVLADLEGVRVLRTDVGGTVSVTLE